MLCGYHARFYPNGDQTANEGVKSRDLDFAKRTGLYIVGIATYLNLPREEWIAANPQDLLGDVVVNVAKRVELQV